VVGRNRLLCQRAGALFHGAVPFFELRAYNAGTGKQVTKTYAHPRQEKGVGIAEAKKQLARPVSAIAEVRYWAKVDPAEQVTLSVLLDEGIAHGETCGLLAGGMTAASTHRPQNQSRIRSSVSLRTPVERRFRVVDAG